MKTYKPNDSARIEAILFTEESKDEVLNWAGFNVRSGVTPSHMWRVNTLEGWMTLHLGSYLCKGTTGEFYPCDPEVFEKRWVEVEPLP